MTDRESEINALLDGELDEARTADLKAAAAEDTDLAQAIILAWQLQKSMDQLEVEKAPASLTRRLRRIPREHADASINRLHNFPRWAAVAGFASLALVLVLALNRPAGAPAGIPQEVVSQPEINPAQVLQARRDLKLAFHYLDKAGIRVGKQIQEVLGDELAAPVKENLTKHLPYTEPSHKEKHA